MNVNGPLETLAAIRTLLGPDYLYITYDEHQGTIVHKHEPRLFVDCDDRKTWLSGPGLESITLQPIDWGPYANGGLGLCAAPAPPTPADIGRCLLVLDHPKACVGTLLAVVGKEFVIDYNYPGKPEGVCIIVSKEVRVLTDHEYWQIDWNADLELFHIRINRFAISTLKEDGTNFRLGGIKENPRNKVAQAPENADQ